MSALLRRLGLLLAFIGIAGAYLALFVSSGWDPRTDPGAFALVVTALGAALVTLAGAAAVWRVARGRSAGLIPLAGALGALGAVIAIALALVGMPVGTREDRRVVYLTAIVAVLAVAGIGWVIVRRR